MQVHEALITFIFSPIKLFVIQVLLLKSKAKKANVNVIKLYFFCLFFYILLKVGP